MTRAPYASQLVHVAASMVSVMNQATVSVIRAIHRWSRMSASPTVQWTVSMDTAARPIRVLATRATSLRTAHLLNANRIVRVVARTVNALVQVYAVACRATNRCSFIFAYQSVSTPASMAHAPHRTPVAVLAVIARIRNGLTSVNQFVISTVDMDTALHRVFANVKQVIQKNG